MPVQKQITIQFKVEIKTFYIEAESKPDAGYFLFAYRIKLTNEGNQSAQLMSRHWIITDAYDQTEEVRGAGVVGLQPKISAGQSFEYESVCPLSTSSGSMKGFYQFVSDQGESFEVEIREFYLIAPTALH